MNGTNISRKIGEQTNTFIIKVACKVGVFCSANNLDVETDQELGRVNKMIPRERLTGQNSRGREGDENKIPCLSLLPKFSNCFHDGGCDQCTSGSAYLKKKNLLCRL